MSFYHDLSDYEEFSEFETASTSRTMQADNASMMSGMTQDSYSDQMTITGQSTYRQDNSEIFVPPLDLQSEMNYSMDSMDSMPEMITHHAKLNQQSKARPPTTYELWLEKKREKKAQDDARRKREEQQREDEINKRKQLAEEKYQAWLARKRQDVRGGCGGGPGPSATSSATPSLAATAGAKATATVVPTPTPSTSGRTAQAAQNDRNAEKQRKMEAWERAKREQAEKRRLEKKKEEEKRRLLEEKRKEESQAAFLRWQQSNKNRPKPVPMNQGMLSLRGTISDIYINPNEWQSILD